MKKYLIILSICSSLMLQAQSDKIYLIMGHPYPHISTQFPGIIFQLEGDSLAEVRQFSEPSLLLENIRYYPDIDYLSVVTYEHKKKEANRMLQTIFTNDINSGRRFEVKFGDNSWANCVKSELVKLEQHEIYDCFTCPDIKNRKLHYFGINIYTGQTREILPEDFAQSLVSGSPGGALDAWDIQLLYTNSENGTLVIPNTPRIEERPQYELVVPNSFQFGKKMRVGVHINSNYFTAINMKIEDSSREAIGISHFIVFNKHTQLWHAWDILGSGTVVRGFGKWIAGNVAASNVTLVFDEQDRLKEKIPLNRVSPGKRERRQKGTDTGTAFDLRADFFELYYPGVLFLHNIDTEKNIEWSTGQGDSEVLLIENEKVYYRVSDILYVANIIKGETLSAPKVLLKDERVPDIHWAFLER